MSNIDLAAKEDSPRLTRLVNLTPHEVVIHHHHYVTHVAPSGSVVLRRRKPQPRSCLALLGVTDLPCNGYWRRKRFACVRLERLPTEVLWDLFQAARAGYRSLVKRVHPDKGGDVARFADATFCWKYLKRWFAGLGIE